MLDLAQCHGKTVTRKWEGRENPVKCQKTTAQIISRKKGMLQRQT